MRMRVSLCMIARNEALTLPRCLKSVAGLVDEIIVVDTGSVDDTRAVAERLGARVYDFAWVDDFAAARNESLRHASGDWVLWLDGDEHFDAENQARLRDLLEGLRDENAAYLMNQRSPLGSSDNDDVMFNQCRLFRNRSAIRWRYRVHEQIQPAAERSGASVRPTEILIEHSGYEDPAVYRRKLERNLRLLLLEDRERPNDPFTLMNLGWAYTGLGQISTALETYRRSLALCKPGEFIAPKLHCLVVRGYHSLGQRPRALAVCQEGRALYPDDLELSFLEAVLRSELGDLPAAEALLVRLLEDRPADPKGIVNHPGMRGHMARHNLARIYRAQGRDTEAETQWRRALAERPQNVRSLFELGRLYVEQGRTAETGPIVQQLDALGPSGGLAAALLRAQSHLMVNDIAAARRLLEAVIANGPPALEPRVMLSRLLMEQGDDPAATEQALRSVLALDPGHAESRRRLAALLDKQGRRFVESELPVRSTPARQQPSPRETSNVLPYGREFYRGIHPGAYRSAQEVVPIILELLRPKSVVDVGCGVGSWLSVFREHGIDDVLGVDGANVDFDLLQIPRERFLPHDLKQPLQLGRKFELALSLEVAEHLPADRAEVFVASLVGLAPVIVFSAAVPHQGGTHHVNEQWPGYWVKLFERHGYLVLDCLREKVWLNDRVDWWYRQNLLVFGSPEALVHNVGLRRELTSATASRLAMVHPNLFLQAVGVIHGLRRQLALLRETQAPPPSP